MSQYTTDRLRKLNAEPSPGAMLALVISIAGVVLAAMGARVPSYIVLGIAALTAVRSLLQIRYYRGLQTGRAMAWGAIFVVIIGLSISASRAEEDGTRGTESESDAVRSSGPNASASQSSDVNPEGPEELTISATSPGWTSTSFTLRPGERFIVSRISGSWTVDSRTFSRVGAAGYDPVTDGEIWDGCKLVAGLPYAVLLGRVGDDTPFAISSPQTYPAHRSGRLELRIHDDDSCLGDNAGEIEIVLEIERR